jgi:hypothetical protein
MDIENILKENSALKEENTILKDKLHKYTHSQKEYYEKNKEIVIQKARENKIKIAEEHPEKIKEYAKKAYLKRKEKLQKIKETENI